MRPRVHTMSWTCAAAIVLTLAFPICSAAQTTERTTAAQAAPNAGQALVDARKALNTVLNAPAPNQQVFEQLNALKTQYLALEKAYSTRGDWQASYAAIMQIVSDLTDAGTATGTVSSGTATTGATGTSGTTATAKLDAQAINNLQAFRKALAAFGVAMGGAAPPSARPAATAGATATTGSTAATSSATGTTGTTAGSSTAATATTPPATERTTETQTATPLANDPHLSEIARLIAAALASEATAAGPDTICVDRKTLQDIQTQVMQLQAGRKPQ